MNWWRRLNLEVTVMGLCAMRAQQTSRDGREVYSTLIRRAVLQLRGAP